MRGVIDAATGDNSGQREERYKRCAQCQGEQRLWVGLQLAPNYYTANQKLVYLAASIHVPKEELLKKFNVGMDEVALLAHAARMPDCPMCNSKE